MSDASIHLKIADFILELIVPNEVSFVLDGGFEGYLIVPSAEYLVREDRSAAAEEREREHSPSAER